MYWFLYNVNTGIVMQSMKTDVQAWTNIPDGCAVCGPFPESDSKFKDAFLNPDFYTVQGGVFTPAPEIEARRTAREAEREQQQAMPTEKQRIESLEAVINDILMGGM